MKHLLVTNDFPPKIGGIQSLLWEWWRRLPPDRFAVLTSPYAGAREFDAEQQFRVERIPEPLSASSSRMTAGPGTAARSAPAAAAATKARPGPGTASREVTGAIESSSQTVSSRPPVPQSA